MRKQTDEEVTNWISGQKWNVKCPQVRLLCEDGEYRWFCCCETGMRSDGLSHDKDCYREK